MFWCKGLSPHITYATLYSHPLNHNTILYFIFRLICFRLTVFFGRGSGPITLIYNTELFIVKRLVFQVSPIYLNLYSSARTDRWTGRQSTGIQLVILIIFIYITLYISLLVSGDTPNSYVNKTVIICSNILQEFYAIQNAKLRVCVFDFFFLLGSKFLYQQIIYIFIYIQYL